MKWFLVILILLGLGAGGFGYYHYQSMQQWLHTPHKADTQPVTIQLPKGSSVRGTLYFLEKQGLVAPSPYIRFVGKVGESVPAVQAGEYELSPALSPLSMLKLLAAGKVKTYSFTIPEGYTVNEVAAVLEAESFAKQSDIFELAKNKAFLKKLGITQLEGYLYPSTYQVPKGQNAKQIITMMVKTFQKQFTDRFKDDAKRKGLTLEQILIMASIIEKEAGSPKEYPLVGSVIHNRMKKGMMLQMDPTVIYGVKNFNGNLTRRHLKTDHPWNTYTRYGLPATPICNPGTGAIKGAIYPASTNYLYFVSMNNGEHIFTSTLRDHNNAVHKYQVLRRVGP